MCRTTSGSAIFPLYTGRELELDPILGIVIDQAEVFPPNYVTDPNEETYFKVYSGDVNAFGLHIPPSPGFTHLIVTYYNFNDNTDFIRFHCKFDLYEGPVFLKCE